jgi:hypothetical protein
VSEVAWTRSLVLLIGPTTYGFSFVVSSVIFGLALGSAAGARWSRRESARSLSWAQLGAALSSLALITILGRLTLPVGHLVHRHADDMIALLGIELAAVAALLLPASFFFGATFPLAVAVVSREGARPAEATGATLAWNTVGALSGSLAAGFLLIPLFGAEGALYAAFGIHLVAAGILFSPKPLVPALAALGLAAATPVVLPRWDRELLSGGLYKYASYLEPGEFLDFLRQGDLLFYREDEVATVTVKKVASRLSLAIDGKVDATNAADMMTQRLLAHVPLLLHPAPKDVLVIGLGSGVTAGSALTHPLASVVAVEISDAVAEASGFFDEVNHRPSADPRFRLVVGDGRNHLLAFPGALRRHHLRALESLDGGSLGSLHPGVLRARPGPARARRTLLPVGPHLQPERGRAFDHRRNLHRRLRRSRFVPAERERPPAPGSEGGFAFRECFGARAPLGARPRPRGPPRRRRPGKLRDPSALRRLDAPPFRVGARRRATHRRPADSRVPCGEDPS